MRGFALDEFEEFLNEGRLVVIYVAERPDGQLVRAFAKRARDCAYALQVVRQKFATVLDALLRESPQPNLVIGE